MPYYVMQFIEGRGLDEVLEEVKRLHRAAEASGGTPTLNSAWQGELTAAGVARSLLTDKYRTETVGDASLERLDADRTARDSDSDSTSISEHRSGPSPGVAPSTVPAVQKSESSVKSLTSWREMARIIRQVASALEYAHSQGVLHRDIKPSNLLLDTSGTVWITDFGLAKANDEQNLTHTGDILGTLRYMPPEAFDGRADARGDIYSLGLTLYELLCLRPAFDERDRNRLIKQVTMAEPARLNRLNAEIPRDLVTIVHKAIERNPVHRYPTAAEFAADLQRFLDDKAIHARRQSQLERFARWSRHNRAIATLGGTLTAVLIIATVVSLLAATRFKQAAEIAQSARHEAEQAGNEARRRGDAERWERYRSNLAEAAAAQQLQNSSSSQRALEAAPEEHRNWEWRHLGTRGE